MSFNSKIAALDQRTVAVFGEGDTVSYQSKAGGDPVTLTEIFDEAFHLSQTEGQNGAIQSTSPGCVLAIADLPNGIDGLSTEGDTITRGETVFYITGIEPSGGLVVLRLSENDPT